MLLDDKKDNIESILSNSLGSTITISNIHSVSGGCINTTYKIITNKNPFFLKLNNHSLDDMFLKEQIGLELIQNTNTITVPNTIYSDKNMLLLEFFEEDMHTYKFWDNFARELASLHMVQENDFGLDHDNYIGSLVQNNTQESNWIDFFIKQRILPQLAYSDFPPDILRSFDKLFIKLNELFPLEKPSLLHGDLWSGNFICNNSKAILIDPAVYFGYREMDISMTKLFGGFDDRFYTIYNEYYPLEEGWKDRVNICNLYPLLVHANLFGGSYYNQIQNILNNVI